MIEAIWLKLMKKRRKKRNLYFDNTNRYEYRSHEQECRQQRKHIDKRHNIKFDIFELGPLRTLVPSMFSL